MPVLLTLSGTGAIYLFDTQIEEILYRDDYFVEPPNTAMKSASALRDAITIGEEEQLITYFPPAAPNRSAAFSLLYDRNKIRNVYVNPYTGAALGEIKSDARIMDTIKRIHALEIFGGFANRLVECVAGWTVVLFVTGAYLWWPRSAWRTALSVRGRPVQRTFWRDVHRVIGIAAGGVLCLQAVTGLPWSRVWGEISQRLIDATGQGIPPMVRNDRPQSTGDARAVDIGLDRVVAIAEEKEFPPGYGVSIPSTPQGVYTIMNLIPDDPAGQRVVHIDRYSGAVIEDIAFSAYGAASKIREYGYAWHQGNLLGTANRLLLLAACVSVWALAATGIVMWWKRRPERGGLATPPLADRREARLVFAITALVSLAFPLTMVSLLVLAAMDACVSALRPERRTPGVQP